VETQTKCSAVSCNHIFGRQDEWIALVRFIHIIYISREKEIIREWQAKTENKLGMPPLLVAEPCLVELKIEATSTISNNIISIWWCWRRTLLPF
jgi:hypothetical protein